MKKLQFLILGLLTMTVVMQPFSGMSQSGVPATPVAEVVTPQIQALARGLQNDPVCIFNYVHDHIRYVHYFGSKKGAQLTLLEKSGNDFDQSALLVAMLWAAGYTNASYQFGWIGAPYNDPDGEDMDLRHWLQLTLVNTNWTNTRQYLDTLFTVRGYPKEVNFTGYTNLYLFQRVWVRLPVGGYTYWLNPSFKVSEPITNILNLTNAMGFSSNGLMTNAGGTDTGNYVTNLSEANIRSTLTGYTANLLNYLQSNAPNASVQQILGGWQIVPSTSTNLSQIDQSFPFDTYAIDPTLYWTYEPTNLMASLKITFAGTNYQWFMPQLEGQRLSLTFSNNGLAQLWQDDTLLPQHSTSGSGTTNVVFAFNQPFGTWNDTSNVLVDTGRGDQLITNLCQCTNATYVLAYAFEPDWGWLQQRQNQLDNYRQQGLPDTSRQVVSETLNIMGMNWLLQTASVEQLLAGQFGILPQYGYRFGRVAQEAGHGYYIDVGNAYGDFPNSGVDTVSQNHQAAHTDLNAYFASALEHGIIEQFQPSNLVAASTVKMLQVANTNGQAVYLASSTNWATVKSKLVNYDTVTSNLIVAYINAGYYILLPQNGSNHVAGTSGWAGCGYEVRLRAAGLPMTNVAGMFITGGYRGAYVIDPNATVSTPTVDQAGSSQPNAFNANSPFTFDYPGADPVGMADGTFQVEHTDLSLGQAEPRGITLSRYYKGTRRYSNPAGMAGGWIHNYSVNANTVPAPQAALGGTTPQQMAPMIVATYAAAGIYNSEAPDPKNWMVSALIAKWGIDQLNKNGVSVIMGKDTVQFVKQPNGTFTPPANCTMTLTQNGSAYSLLQRHGNTFNFDSVGRLSTIVDQYNNPLSLTYTNNLVKTVTDWKSRSLTFTYTGGQLTSVSDNSTPSRTIHYSYSTANAQGDLTSYTDAEGKITTYTYDTNHEITATLNALNQLVVSNLYDGFGHVTMQYTQGDTNKAWQIFWSGWQSIEQDPVGSQRVFSYDNKSRVTSLRDALGNLTQTFYDGQSHVVMIISPLNETNQFIYDGNNNLLYLIDALNFTSQFVYDNQNNLTSSVDARGNPCTFGYNAQFSLTGLTNGAGDWVNYTYNADGTLHSRADVGGTTTYDYDSFGQLNGITYPGGLGGESFVNSSLGDPTSHTDANGNVMSFQYNERRQLTNTIAPTNLTVGISFDAVGNVAGITDARSNTTSKTWSATRYLLATTLPSTPQGVPVITNAYDNRDWLTRTVDPLQNPTLYTNDVAGRLISLTDPVLRTTTFGYDADGRRLTIVNAANETISQTWDARGSLLKLTDGAGHFSLRTNDAAGNLIILTNRNGKKWQFQFDGANRLINTITPLNRSTSLTFNHQGLLSTIKDPDPAHQPTSLYYDAKGRLTNRTDNVGTTLYGYDANDNLTSVTNVGQASSLSQTFDAYNRMSSFKDVYGNLIQYRYDANGNVTDLIYPGNRTVTYFYDSLNRMTNVTDWSGRKTAITYDLDSRVKSIMRPNGTYRTIGYDAAGQATNILEQTAIGFPIALFRFNWTNSGNMAWEFAAPLPHTNTPPTRNMTYDDDNQLASFKGPSMGSYQAVGTDSDGNLTSAPLTNDTFVIYTYDARNRLLNSGGVTNAYDAANNRIGQTYGTNTTVFVVNPNTKLSQVLMRIKNGVTTYYVYGPGLLYQVTETATTTNTLTYHYDYRGSTIALSDNNGNVTDRIEYSAYGLTTYRAGTNDTPFLFNGRYGVQTDANGLLYMRARFYNPYLCRFLNPDPSGFAGGLNHYAAFNGNPVSYLDPFGLNAAITGDTSFNWTGTSDNSVPNITMTINPNVNTGPQMGPPGFTPAAPYYNPYLPTTMSVNSPVDEAFQQNLTAGVQMAITGYQVVAFVGIGLLTDGLGDLADAEGTTSLYRAVSQAEYNQLMTTSTFQTSANSLTGKFFAESAADAAQWGTKLNGPGNFQVIEVQFPNSTANSFLRWPSLDGIGPARYGEIGPINAANPVIKPVP